MKEQYKEKIYELISFTTMTEFRPLNLTDTKIKNMLKPLGENKDFLYECINLCLEYNNFYILGYIIKEHKNIIDLSEKKNLYIKSLVKFKNKTDFLDLYTILQEDDNVQVCSYLNRQGFHNIQKINELKKSKPYLFI